MFRDRNNNSNNKKNQNKTSYGCALSMVWGCLEWGVPLFLRHSDSDRISRAGCGTSRPSWRAGGRSTPSRWPRLGAEPSRGSRPAVLGRSKADNLWTPLDVFCFVCVFGVVVVVFFLGGGNQGQTRKLSGQHPFGGLDSEKWKTTPELHRSNPSHHLEGS